MKYGDQNKQRNAISPENKQSVYFSVCLECFKIEVYKLNPFSPRFLLLTTDAVNIKSVSTCVEIGWLILPND